MHRYYTIHLIGIIWNFVVAMPYNKYYKIINVTYFNINIKMVHQIIIVIIDHISPIFKLNRVTKSINRYIPWFTNLMLQLPWGLYHYIYFWKLIPSIFIKMVYLSKMFKVINISINLYFIWWWINLATILFLTLQNIWIKFYIN